MATTSLLVLSEREAIWWLLSNRRMAWPSWRRALVSTLDEGDRLLLYATRGAWHCPTRDRGRVIGEARVASPVLDLDEPVVVYGRPLGIGCRLDVDGMVPYPGGVELGPLVPSLHAFPEPASWAVVLRRPLLPLDGHDARAIRSRLRPLLVPLPEALSGYRAAAGVPDDGSAT